VSINSKCPCGSNRKYKLCCKPFHAGKLAPNALTLMKSRYCAYALNEYKYIINTTHKDNVEFTEDKKTWQRSIQNFIKQTKFENLDIVDFSDDELQAFVTFRAKLSSNGEDTSFMEKSRFIKENGRWYYIDGTLI
jgi:SEC-C motif-containing protein